MSDISVLLYEVGHVRKNDCLFCACVGIIDREYDWRDLHKFFFLFLFLAALILKKKVVTCLKCWWKITFDGLLIIWNLFLNLTRCRQHIKFCSRKILFCFCLIFVLLSYLILDFCFPTLRSILCRTLHWKHAEWFTYLGGGHGIHDFHQKKLNFGLSDYKKLSLRPSKMCEHITVATVLACTYV